MANLRHDTKIDREGLEWNPPHVPGTANALLADLLADDWHDIIAGRDTGIDARRQQIILLRRNLQDEDTADLSDCPFPRM